MSSTVEPTDSTEKPILEPISTSTDFYSTEVTENQSKSHNAKNIGTTTPEVEGEEQQMIAAVDDYPTTPVSATDPKSDSVLRLTETPETKTEEAPLPPSSSVEPSPSISLKEAQEKALPEETALEKVEVEEGQKSQQETTGSSLEVGDETSSNKEHNEGDPETSETRTPLETTDRPQTEEPPNTEVQGEPLSVDAKSESLDVDTREHSEKDIPEVVVELTAENQPSHGDDLGPDSTPGQKEAFEKRKADAEADVLLVVEEPSDAKVIPNEDNAVESTEAEKKGDLPTTEEEDERERQAEAEKVAAAELASIKAKEQAEAERLRLVEEENERERLAAIEAARVKAEEEEEAARIKAAEEEAARVKAEQEAEAARVKAEEEEAARVKAEEEEAARIKAEQEAEAARIKAEEEAEAARIKAEEEEAA
ncbi:hypothetical protein P167DRAFT_578632, partial [Morchella conica CCBAS932]